MPKRELKIISQKFAFNRLEDEESFCEVFIEEPQDHEKKTLGNLYFMGEIRSPYKDPPYLLNLLNSVIKSEYYSYPKRSVSESLEASLKAANLLLSNLAKEGNIDWLRGAHFLVATVSKNALCFSHLGEIQVLLKRGKNITDLVKKPEPGSQDLMKSFTNVVSGDLHQGDTLFFSTKGILEVFQKESLINALRSAHSIPLNKIEEIIRSNEHLTTSPIAALILEISPTFEREAQHVSSDYVSESPALNNGLKILRGLVWIFVQVIKALLKGGLFIIKNLTLLFLAIFRKLKTGGKSATPQMQPSTQKDIEAGATQKIQSKSRAFQQVVWDKFLAPLKSFNLGMIQKEAAILLILIIFSFGFVYLYNERGFGSLSQSQAAILQEIKEKTEEAEEALIFQDKEKANALLLEAEELFNQISATEPSKSLENEISQLKESIATRLDELNGAVSIEEPKIILELKKLPLNFFPTNFSSSDKVFYFYDAAKNIFYKFDPEDESKNFIFLPDSSDSEKLNLMLSFEGPQKILFYIPDRKILFYENGELSEVTALPLESNDYFFKDISSYKNNIYFLEPNLGQIIKYQITTEGINPMEFWIKDDSEENIKEAKSITIDGAIYVLTKDGEILKYAYGKLRKSWGPNEIKASLNGASKIFTRSDLDYIYILDSVNKKVLVLDKMSNIIKQYKSEAFDNLNDIEVFPEKNKIHLLNGLKVYEIEI